MAAIKCPDCGAWWVALIGDNSHRCPALTPPPVRPFPDQSTITCAACGCPIGNGPHTCPNFFLGPSALTCAVCGNLYSPGLPHTCSNSIRGVSTR